MLAALVALAACGGGGGGGGAPPPGKTYGYVDWTSDIQAADFTNIGLPSPFFRNTRYQLTTGTARVFWRSDWLGCCIDYFLDVTIRKAESGKDRVYEALISGDTLFWDTFLVPIGEASADSGPLEAIPAQHGGFFEQGRIVETR